MSRLFATAVIMIVLPVSLVAQEWRWPDKPKNLTVLPQTTTARELQRTMFSFTSGLGVRCAYCHVGEDGKDWNEFDFASDDKPEKEKARTMLKMVKAINSQYLTELAGHSASSLEVNCVTCHRGNTIPILLEDKLKRTYDKQGIDSTIKQYRALRERYYGGFTYSFRERVLLRLADKIYEDTTKIADAMKVANLNMEMYPAFTFSYEQLAGYYIEMGDKKSAIETYELALKQNPNDKMLKEGLEMLKGK